MEKVISVTDEVFEKEIISEKPVLVEVWAEWCGPCKMIGPIVEQLANDYEGKAVVMKLNADDNPETTARFGVRNIPTILFFKNGHLVDRQVGFVSKSILVNKLTALE